jgi:hypothetical protein
LIFSEATMNYRNLRKLGPSGQATVQDLYRAKVCSLHLKMAVMEAQVRFRHLPFRALCDNESCTHVPPLEMPWSDFCPLTEEMTLLAGGAVESAALSAAGGSISSSRWRGSAHGAGHTNAGVPQASDWTIRSAA